MRFSKYIEGVKPEWSLYFLNYQYLKDLVLEMERGISSGTMTKAESEHKFTIAIELEITKVNNFFLLTKDQLGEELIALKQYLNKMVCIFLI